MDSGLGPRTLVEGPACLSAGAHGRKGLLWVPQRIVPDALSGLLLPWSTCEGRQCEPRTVVTRSRCEMHLPRDPGRHVRSWVQSPCCVQPRGQTQTAVPLPLPIADPKALQIRRFLLYDLAQMALGPPWAFGPQPAISLRW